MLTAQEADAARRVAGRVHRDEFVLAKAKTLTILNAVVGLDRHHRLVRLVTGELRMGLLAYRLQSLHVVGVAMRRQDMADPQALEFLDDAWCVVGGVDQERLFALRIAQYVDVVVVGTDGERREPVHGLSLSSPMPPL